MVVVSALAAGVALAQTQPKEDVLKKVEEIRVQAMGAGGMMPSMATFEFVAGEMLGASVVKGQPYSAEAVTETVQMLGDGNRITRKTSANIYRDSEGRERREQSIQAIGSVPVKDGGQTIFISDPVAKLSWSLNPQARTAMKMPRPEVKVLSSNGAAAGGKATVVTGSSSQVIELRREGQPTDVMTFSASVSPSIIAGPGPTMFERHMLDSKNVKTESLGKQTIEGVLAEGTRTTITIPAGEIGNERPIETVSERWYSPELQVVVMTRRSDPRSGETTYKLTRINRTEPLKSLFEVPSDYTVSEPAMRIRQMEGDMKKHIEEIERRSKRPQEIF
jgi:hypothetical protein